MKILKHLIAGAFMLGISSMASAAVPPPPVNQNIGIPDTVFSFQDASVCNNCHGGNPPIGVPVNLADNKDRHHKKVGEPIDGQPDFPPFPDANGDGINEATFDCYNCHALEFNPATGMNELVQNFRNCLNCHVWQAGDTSVHHRTIWAQEGTCFKCHGGIVRGIDVATLTGKMPSAADPNVFVPVRIMDYATTMITPWRSGKPDGDDRIVNAAGTSPGNCNFCHNTGDGLPGAPTGGTPEVFTLQDGTTTTIGIFTNIENHHGTGFANEGKCAWCHIQDAANQAGTIADEIKSCQRCHDQATLHNIEFDAVGDGTQPGQEEAYFGHIGNVANCWGCHGNNQSADSLTDADSLTNQSVSNNTVSGDPTTSLVPTLNTLTIQSVPSGEDTVITATGTHFTNDFSFTSNGETIHVTYLPEVNLTDSSGNFTAITPTTMDATTLTFTLPASMPADSYYVTIRKYANYTHEDFIQYNGLGNQHTNPLNLVVTPSMLATNAFIYSPYGSLVVLFGTGFTDSLGMYGVMGGQTELVDQNGNPPITMYAWQDNMIVALFDENPESVKVTNIYGEKTFDLELY